MPYQKYLILFPLCFLLLLVARSRLQIHHDCIYPKPLHHILWQFSKNTFQLIPFHHTKETTITLKPILLLINWSHLINSLLHDYTKASLFFFFFWFSRFAAKSLQCKKQTNKKRLEVNPLNIMTITKIMPENRDFIM